MQSLAVFFLSELEAFPDFSRASLNMALFVSPAEGILSGKRTTEEVNKASGIAGTL